MVILPKEDKAYKWDTPLSELLLLASMFTIFAVTFVANSGHESCKVIRSKDPGPECSTTYFSISRWFDGIYNSSLGETPQGTVSIIIDGNTDVMSSIAKDDWCNYYLSPYQNHVASLQVGSTQLQTRGSFIFHHPEQSRCWTSNCTWDDIDALQIATNLMVSSRDVSITLQHDGNINYDSDMAKYFLVNCIVNTWISSNAGIINTDVNFYPDDVCSRPIQECNNLPNGSDYRSILKTADPSHCATQLTFYYMALARTLMCNSNFTYPSPQIYQQTSKGFINNFNEDVSYLTFTCTQCTSRSTYETLSITAAGVWTILSVVLFSLRVSYKVIKSVPSSAMDSKYNGLDVKLNRASGLM